MAKHKKSALSKNKLRFKAPKLTPTKEKELFAVINSDTSIVKEKDDAKKTLCESLLPLVFSLASDYATRCPYLDKNDLIGEGTQGALEAIRRFDTNMNTRLASYSYKFIKHSITDACNTYSSALRPSPARRRRIKQLQAEINRFELEHGRKATDQEIHQITGFSNKYIQNNRNGVITVVSLDANLNPQENSASFLETYENDENGCDFREEIYRKEKHKFLRESLAKLDARTQEAIVVRFGFDGKGHKTLKDTSEKLHLSIETVRRIVAAGIVKLQIMLCNPHTVA